MSRTIVITGATRGCGRALAEGCAALGHQVFGCGRSVGDGIDGVELQSVDIADDDAVAAWAQGVLDQSTPDLLLNNAAIMNRPCRLWELPAKEFDAVIDINIKGSMNCIRQFVPAMIEAGRGVVVNFSSGWGRSTAADMGPYCTTKWAIEGLSGSLAKELPAGLACVAVNPGIINTEMLQSCWGDGAASFPDPEAWSRSAIPFLLSLEAEHNGQALSCP